MLFWQDNLSSSTHTVSLTANPNANTTEQLAFDKAVFTNIGVNATYVQFSVHRPRLMLMVLNLQWHFSRSD